MNASELAQKMLEWEEARKAIDGLEAEIKAAVIEIGKTQTVGNVRASYSKGRKSYDYHKAYFDVYSEASVERIMELQDLIRKYTEPVTDWRAVCKDGNINGVPFTQGDPSVSVKLVGEK